MSSRESGRRVQAARLTPPPDLAFAVEALWWGAWDLRGQPAHETHLLGDPCLHVVFEEGESRIVGVWTRLWTRVLEGQGAVRAVKLRAGAVRMLLPNAEAHAFTNRVVSLDRWFEGVQGLTETILRPADPVDGLRHLADWLRRRVHRDAEGRLAVRVVRHIAEDEALRVEAVAEFAGLSVRSLQRLFRRHVGASPKSVIRRFRLQEVAARIERGEAPDLATLAWQLGYADQAHLARDFRSATGQTLRGFERTLDVAAPTKTRREP